MARVLYGTVDAAPVREHLLWLTQRGVALAGVAEAARVNPKTLEVIARGQVRRTNQDIARRVCNTTLGDVIAVATTVPRVGARRRIQALAAIGWSLRLQRDQFARRRRPGQGRILPANVLYRSESPHIRRATHEVIAETYQALCMTPGPSSAARRRAARLGWPPPLAWDDIDDPDETPQGYERDQRPRQADEVDHVVVWRRMEGIRSDRPTRAEAELIVGELARRGRSVTAIEHTTGLNPRRYRHVLEEARSA
jgi:hypothetical protein